MVATDGHLTAFCPTCGPRQRILKARVYGKDTGVCDLPDFARRCTVSLECGHRNTIVTSNLTALGILPLGEGLARWQAARREEA